MRLFSSKAVVPTGPGSGLVNKELERFSARYASQSTILFGSGADPFVSNDNDWFYYMHTTGNSICLWRGRTLAELAVSKPRIVLDTVSARGSDFRNVWAPEMHRIGERWYIYYAADDGRNERHRIHVLGSETSDPFGNWKLLGRLKTPSENWAIDATTFCDARGRRYLVWSGWTKGEGQRQSIFIAEMHSPTDLGPVEKRLSQPEGRWEGWINEGPQVLVRDGQISIIYSGNGWWTRHYALGCLRLEGKDPLQPKNWRKQPDPVFSADGKLPRTLSIGHASFLHSSDHAQGIMIYHALVGPQKREVRAQLFEWSGRNASFGIPRAPILAPVENLAVSDVEQNVETVTRSA